MKVEETETIHGKPIPKGHGKFLITEILKEWSEFEEDMHCVGAFLTRPMEMTLPVKNNKTSSHGANQPKPMRKKKRKGKESKLQFLRELAEKSESDSADDDEKHYKYEESESESGREGYAGLSKRKDKRKTKKSKVINLIGKRKRQHQHRISSESSGGGSDKHDKDLLTESESDEATKEDTKNGGTG